MEGSLVTLDEVKLVGFKVVGRRSELSHRVPPAWLELVRRLDEIPYKVAPDLFYGAFAEADHLHDGIDGIHTYWVGTEVSEYGELPSGFATLTIPSRTYAMATVRGGAAEVDATYTGLSQWIRAHGHATAPQAFGFERYDNRRQRVTPPYEQFDFDIFKPLA